MQQKTAEVMAEKDTQISERINFKHALINLAIFFGKLAKQLKLQALNFHLQLNPFIKRQKPVFLQQKFIQMRITTTILFFFLCFFIFQNKTQAQTAAQDSTFMQFDLKGAPEGWAKLIGMYGEQRYIIDSAIVDVNGKFSLRRKKTIPAGYYYWLLQGGKNFSFLVDADDQRFTMKGDMDDLVNTTVIEGSLNTKLFYETTKVQSEQEPRLAKLANALRSNPPTSETFLQAKKVKDEILAEREAYLQGIYKKYPDLFFTRFKISGQNPEVNDFRKPNGDLDTLRQLTDYRAHFWDGVDFTDDRLLFTPVISNKLSRYIKELTPQNPDSIIKVADPLIDQVLSHKEYFKFFTNWIAMQYENGKTSVMDGEAVYVHIIQKYFTDELAFWDKSENLEKLRKHAWEMEASLLNKKGPDVLAADVVTGEMRSIYALKSPLIVVFMYSPHCEHCQAEAPLMEQIYKKWKPLGVEVYGIGVNCEKEELKQFIFSNNFTFSTVFDETNRAIYAKYYVDNTPEMYVLNKDRIIVAKNLKAEQLETIFEREMKK